MATPNRARMGPLFIKETLNLSDTLIIARKVKKSYARP